MGGESPAALARAAEYGDGWYGFNLGAEEATEKVASLRALLAKRGRDAARFEIVVAPFTKPVVPGDLERYRAAGVDEVAIVASPPADDTQVAAWVESLAHDWVEPAALLG
jgi:alkanesulfonate monooxygenase SsuD/methylene tetrahydromethanopterin reductase-like flavin-dependent oxidoreductase (luciferase family)